MDEPPFSGSELDVLISYLDFYRGAILRKAEGLTDDQARFRPTETANSILNLLVHLTGVENFWMHYVILGHPIERNRDAEFLDQPDELTLLTAVANYRTTCDRSNSIAHDLESLDQSCRGEGFESLDARGVILHVFEETARHAGHADITRELIDGSVGL